MVGRSRPWSSFQSILKNKKRTVVTFHRASRVFPRNNTKENKLFLVNSIYLTRMWSEYRRREKIDWKKFFISKSGTPSMSQNWWVANVAQDLKHSPEPRSKTDDRKRPFTISYVRKRQLLAIDASTNHTRSLGTSSVYLWCVGGGIFLKVVEDMNVFLFRSLCDSSNFRSIP